MQTETQIHCDREFIFLIRSEFSTASVIREKIYSEYLLSLFSKICQKRYIMGTRVTLRVKPRVKPHFMRYVIPKQHAIYQRGNYFTVFSINLSYSLPCINFKLLKMRTSVILPISCSSVRNEFANLACQSMPARRLKIENCIFPNFVFSVIVIRSSYYISFVSLCYSDKQKTLKNTKNCS